MKQLISKTIVTCLAIVLLGGGLLVGARKITRATQTKSSACMQQSRWGCSKIPKQICSKPIFFCSLDKAK